MAHLIHLRGAERRRYVSSLFTRIIDRYDMMNDIMSLGLVRLWRAETARLATEGLEGSVLDVAAGTGGLSLALASRGVQVVGLDLVTSMLRRARERVLRRDTRRPEFIAGDALSLPCSSATFGAVTSAFGMRNMPDVSAALREMVRVARPGGRVVVLEIMPPGENMGIVRRAIWFYLRTMVPILGAVLARDRDAYCYLKSSVADFLTPEQLASCMEEAGLVEVSFRLGSFGTVAIHTGTKPA